LFKAIEKAQHIVLITHKNPDADSLGAASAFYTLLMQLHKKVTLFCVSEQIDPRLAFLPWFDKMRHQFPSKADLAISFDCGAYSRLGVDVAIPLINIDHHQSNSAYGDINLLDMSAISTTQVLFELFEAKDIRLNQKMATALYAGLIDDSNAFKSDKTDARTFKMAEALVRAKAETGLCVQELFQRSSLAKLRLKAKMLAAMRLFDEGRVVVHLVDAEMIAESGAKEVDCEDALNESLHLVSVEIALMLRENRDGTIKGSLRSSVERDVEKIAKAFGGGGHKHASGFDLEADDLELLRDKILSKIKEEVR